MRGLRAGSQPGGRRGASGRCEARVARSGRWAGPWVEGTALWKDRGAEAWARNLLEDTAERVPCPEVESEGPSEVPARHSSALRPVFLVIAFLGSAVHFSLAVNKGTDLGKPSFTLGKINWHRSQSSILFVSSLA